MPSGLCVAHASSSNADAIAAQIVEQFGEQISMSAAPSLVLLFVSSMLDFPAVTAAVTRALPDSQVVACTTCGEIGPSGCTMGKVSAFAFGAPTRARAVLLEDLGQLKYERCVAAVEGLVEALDPGGAAVRERPREFVFVTIIDGLSGAEERLLAAIARTAPGVPLVGGSAADDFRFQSTQVALGERCTTGGALLILLEPGRAFEPFHLHHYERGATPIVVTAADPERRLVERLDGYPAVTFLAKFAGVDEQALRADPLGTLGSRQAVFGVELGTKSGPATFMRSTMDVKGDALLLGGSVDEGALLYPMIAGDLVETTRAGIERAVAAVDDAQALLLFNCGGRMFEATAQGLVERLAEAMLPIPGAGFTTYGEQFGAVQINHTLTGLVLGRAHDS